MNIMIRLIFVIVCFLYYSVGRVFAQLDKSDSLSEKSREMFQLGKYQEALQLGLEAFQIRKEIVGKNHPDYISSLNDLALFYSSMGDYIESVRYGTEALNIYEEVFGKDNLNYAMLLSNLATFYSDTGDNLEAVRLGTKALLIREQILGKEHPIYAESLDNLAIFNSDIGNYTESVRLGTEALRIREETLGKNHLEYAASLNNLAITNSYLGNYTESIRLGTEALRIREKKLGKNHPEYALLLNNISNFKSRIGKFEDALSLVTEALIICEKRLGKNHPEYALFLSNLANYNAYLGNYQEAIRIGTEVLDIQEKTIGKIHPDYSGSLNNLSGYYFYLGNYQEAIRIGIEALNIRQKVFGKKHSLYVMSLSNLAMYHYYNGDIGLLDKYAMLYYNISSNIIQKTFIDLIEQERRLFWNKYQKEYQTVIHQFTHKYPTDTLIKCGYNAALMSKGLLLNLTNEMSNLITNSKDSVIITLYEELKLNRRQLSKIYESTYAKRMIKTDSLEAITYNIEKELLSKSKIYGNYVQNLTIQWEDVQKGLNYKDACIEFISFPQSTDSIIYVAYVLRKDMDYPKLVPLFEEKQLKKDNRLYNTSSVSKLVWEPLAEYLNGAQNVYFAPAGELYNIGIEYLPHWSGEGRMTDKWNMYRLSSTRQLAVIKDKNALKQAAVYGGVIYDTKEDLLVADSRKYRSQERSFNYEAFAIADSLNLRAGASYLPATKTEAEDIDKTLEQKKIMTMLLIDTLATEGAFKDLSGKKTNLLHIATHGFYWTEKEARYKDNLNFLMLNDNHPRYIEDKALTRSGLLLAGANNALMGKKLPEGVDDGILTAKEISQLDLRGLDLVVLSACETGLGEIKGDGVFGLQRGFKKAGANSLLMSLWKVDDNATQLLMTQFYKNLTSGMSKFESLRQAQKYVRDYEVEVEVKSDSRPAVSAHAKEQAQQNANKEKIFKKVKKYEDPKYWAAFILLDAID